MPIENLTDDKLKLDVSLYGDVEKLTDTLSKCRCRIFYKGMNRNRTFISDDFANQLIASLPYAPIKGIFDITEVDFEGHGEDNTDGQIYGVTAAEPNFAWEDHLDSDGVTRTYATAEVILYTALYPESKLISGKGQSMEIYRNTVKGEWRIAEDGYPFFYFLEGSLLGLQVLGDEHEPCFEGSAFFNLYKKGEELFEYIKTKKQEGNNKMLIDKNLFMLSDDEKKELIWRAVNPNFNEENDWEVDYFLLEVYSDYAICKSTKDHKDFKISYTKDDVTNSVTVGAPEEIFSMYLTAAEKGAIENLRLIGGSFESSVEKVEELNSTVETLNAAAEDAKTTIETLNSTIEVQSASIETLTADVDTYKIAAEKVPTLEENISTLTTEKEALEQFKFNIENTKKEEILDEFSEHLNDEQIKDFKDNIETYEIVDFKKEVLAAAYESDPSIFQKKTSDLIYKGGDPEASVEERGAIKLLKKYKNGGNK